MMLANNAGMNFQALEHVTVIGRVADVIENPVVVFRIVPEPFNAADSEVFAQPLIRHLRLIDNELDLVVGRERGDQF